MKSMTGFGYSEYRDERRHIVLALKSYNNRFLDISVYLPHYLAQLEIKVRDFLASRIMRGRVELSLKATEFEENPNVILDKSSVQVYVRTLTELAEAAGINEKVRLSHLLKIEGILKTEMSQDIEEYWEFLKPHLEAAFRQFEQMRLSDGAATREDIRRLLAVIDSEICKVEAQSSRIEARIKEGLKTRFYELLGNGIDENRILSETAVMLMKYDINEELVRIRSYMNNFKNSMKESGAPGKKLDFICQELNREVNTIGSKSMMLDVSNAVVVLKDSLEKIREQLRNVE